MFLISELRQMKNVCVGSGVDLRQEQTTGLHCSLVTVLLRYSGEQICPSSSSSVLSGGWAEMTNENSAHTSVSTIHSGLDGYDHRVTWTPLAPPAGDLQIYCTQETYSGTLSCDSSFCWHLSAWDFESETDSNICLCHRTRIFTQC